MKSMIILKKYNKYELIKLRDRCTLLGNDVIFENDKWICNKKASNSNIKPCFCTICFDSCPEQYRSYLKYFVLLALEDQKRKITTVRNRVIHMCAFFRYIQYEVNGIDIESLNCKIFDSYEEEIRRRDIKMSYRAIIIGSIKQLFDVLHISGILHKEYIIPNPFSFEKPQKNDNKYINDTVMNQLDIAFDRDDILPHVKLAYWLMRCIPSRVSEIAGMILNCVKPYGNNWVVFIPTTKQSGNTQPEIKCIHIKDEGMGQKVLSLIRLKQKETEELQENMPQDYKGFLFAYRINYFTGWTNDKKMSYSGTSRCTVVDSAHISREFNKVCERFRILNGNGQIYRFTTHQLRHNGITDRLEKGFSYEQIRFMTGHHGNGMISSTYDHTNLFKDKLYELSGIDNKEEQGKSPVYFKGKIFNMSPEKEKEVLSNLRALRLKRGICMDITNCSSGDFECLNKCPHFIYDVNDYDYFKNEIVNIDNKVNLFEKQPLIIEKLKHKLKCYEYAISQINSICKGESE